MTKSEASGLKGLVGACNGLFEGKKCTLTDRVGFFPDLLAEVFDVFEPKVCVHALLGSLGCED